MWLLGYVRRMIDSWFVANNRMGLWTKPLLFDVGARDEYCMGVNSYVCV